MSEVREQFATPSYPTIPTIPSQPVKSAHHPSTTASTSTHETPTVDGPKTIHVTLADCPTDVLVHLVDHGTASIATLMGLVPAGGTPAAVFGAIGLLRQLGYVSLDATPEGASKWTATTAGRAAVAAARDAAS